MRIVAVSDTHGRSSVIEDVFSKYSDADLFLHLGDGLFELGLIKKMHPGIPVLSVRGNCDAGSKEPLEMVFEEKGRTLFMTHGHRYWVKSGLSDLEERAHEAGASTVFFGHTHEPLCLYRDGIWYLNPGSAGIPEDGIPKTAVLDITESGMFGFLDPI
ncbi:MAG: YfcE family phosphodiesterase [Oscillospiraceae bacterium]|jgi:putative phosphoesterase